MLCVFVNIKLISNKEIYSFLNIKSKIKRFHWHGVVKRCDHSMVYIHMLHIVSAFFLFFIYPTSVHIRVDGFSSVCVCMSSSVFRPATCRHLHLCPVQTSVWCFSTLLTLCRVSTAARLWFQRLSCCFDRRTMWMCVFTTLDRLNTAWISRENIYCCFVGVSCKLKMFNTVCCPAYDHFTKKQCWPPLSIELNIFFKHSSLRTLKTRFRPQLHAFWKWVRLLLT